jgi:hypothetical protein
MTVNSGHIVGTESVIRCRVDGLTHPATPTARSATYDKTGRSLEAQGCEVVSPPEFGEARLRTVTTKGQVCAPSRHAMAARTTRESRGPDRGSEHISSDRPILEGCRRFIGPKSPALAEKYRQVLPRRKWRT